MRLAELEPAFLRHSVTTARKGRGRPRPNGTIQWGGFPTDSFHPVKTLAEAQGIRFNCPKCSPEGRYHGIYVWFEGRGAPETFTDGSTFFPNSQGQRVRWKVEGGTGINDLQLSPSILVQGGCGWHGFIGTSGAPPGHVITC